MARRSSNRGSKKSNAKSQTERGLIIAGSSNSRLTKAQRTFNQLVRQIAQLEEDIANENRRLDTMVSFYAAEVYPMEQEIARIRFQILVKLDAHSSQGTRRTNSKRNPFLKILKEQLVEHLSQLGGNLDEAFNALFLKIMKCTPEEYKLQRAHEEQEEIEREFQSMDLDVDLSALTPDADPETVLRTLDEIRQKLNGPADDAGKSQGKKTAEDLYNAEQERLLIAEELRKNDLSSLYKQLAKLLHPDLEQDPERRSAKEAAMKHLNAAYDARDLHAMLKLEIEWIHQEGLNSSQLSDQKLAIYNAVLEDQVGELQEMLENVWMHPRFSSLAKFAIPFLGLGFADPLQIKHSVRTILEVFQKSLKILNSEPSPRELGWLTSQLGPRKQRRVEDLF